MTKKSCLLTSALLLLFFSTLQAQEIPGRISGSFQLDAQTYKADSLIGATAASEKMLLNSYANIRYDQGGFSAGLRFEGYLNTLKGFDPAYDGVGIANYFIRYRTKNLDFTVGDYYEQFGTGILLRAWEDKYLGVDNAIRGVRLRYTPIPGIRIMGVVGKQRHFWSLGDGIVRGLDGNISVNDLFPALNSLPTRIDLGGSFVSKYQPDEDPIYILPENVGAWSYRFNLNHGGFHLETEYAMKINDPSADNNFIYKGGNALIINAGYATSGLGINISAKRIDNMSFRSDRNENLNKLMLGYLPPISKAYTYSLMNLYPYGSQPNGEMGIEGEISYRIKRGSKLGGKYGTQLTFNMSMVNDINKTALNDTIAIGTPGTMGYNSEFFKIGETKFFRDINFEISRKISKKWKAIAIYQYLNYNQLVMEGKGGMISANIAVLDITYKIRPRQAIKLEAQGLWTKEDKGNWAMLQAEYTVSPHWFVSVSDQYNYGNPHAEKRIHYVYGSMGYIKDATRIQLSYGKQREGILCVGGVCRNVPAMNGFSLSLSTSF